MKTQKTVHRILAIAFLSVAVALAGFVWAATERPTSTDPVPIIVKNGPGPWFLDAVTWNLIDKKGVITLERPNAGLSNMLVQTYFVRVETNSANGMFLTNTTSSPITNYFSADSPFSGNESVTFGALGGEANQAYVEYDFDTYVFTNTSQGKSLLLFLGKSGDYEAAYVGSVNSPVNATNNTSSPIVTTKADALNTGTSHSFSIYAPAGVSTNLDLRAYLAQVTNSTNGNLYLTHAKYGQHNLTTNDYLKSATNLFDGVTPVQIKPGGSSEVSFELNPDAFDIDGQGPCYLIFLGYSITNGKKFEVAYSFLVRP